MPQREIELDVRELLKAKQDPFEVIMQQVDTMQEGDILNLHTTFEPIPLLKVMKNKGFDNNVQQLEPEHYVVTFFRS